MNALLPMLEKTSANHSFSGPTGRIAKAPSDVALYIMLKLSRQDPDDYDLLATTSGPSFSIIGFSEDTKRTAAIARYKEWWEQNKTRDTYKNLPTVTLPNIDTNNRGPNLGTVMEYIE